MTAAASHSTQQVDILLFEVGGTRYGADASVILRIDRPDETAHAAALLGTLQSGHRALVYLAEDVERRLRVDLVHGVRTVSVDELRRMPPAAGSPQTLIGCWLDGEQPVVLIDLLKTRTLEDERR